MGTHPPSMIRQAYAIDGVVAASMHLTYNRHLTPADIVAREIAAVHAVPVGLVELLTFVELGPLPESVRTPATGPIAPSVATEPFAAVSGSVPGACAGGGQVPESLMAAGPSRAAFAGAVR